MARMISERTNDAINKILKNTYMQLILHTKQVIIWLKKANEYNDNTGEQSFYARFSSFTFI